MDLIYVFAAVLDVLLIALNKWTWRIVGLITLLLMTFLRIPQDNAEMQIIFIVCTWVFLMITITYMIWKVCIDFPQVAVILFGVLIIAYASSVIE